MSASHGISMNFLATCSHFTTMFAATSGNFLLEFKWEKVLCLLLLKGKARKNA